MSFLHQLRRRHVIRVTVAYLAGSWLLIQVLETLFPIFAIPETSIRVVVVVLAIGLVPAIILSWIFQWTPQGLQRDSDNSPATETSAGASRTLDRVIIATLTVALGYFALDKFVIAPGYETTQRDAAAEMAKRYASLYPRNDTSIAVMPFTNMSSDPEQQYFAEGLSEELLNSLVRIKDLRVTSRTSSFAFRQRNLPIAEIATVLGVGHILEGSVRRSGDRIRITAQLIDTKSDTHLWSETFDRTLSVDNVLNIQAEIAATVASALQLELSPRAADGSLAPASMDAFDLYIDGMHYSNLLDPMRDDVELNMGKAIAKLQAAIAVDSNWAPPRVELATVYIKTKHSRNVAERLDAAMGHVRDALRIDPDHPFAHAALAYLLVVDGDYEGGILEYDRAQSLGANVHWGKAILLRMLARHSEAIDEFHAGAAKDPMGPMGMFQLFETYYCAGRYAEAIDGFTEFFSEALQQRDGYIAILVANAYARTGDMQSALEFAEAFVAHNGDEAPVASVFVLAGQTERARGALQTVETSGQIEPFVFVDIAPTAVLLGDQARAMDLLEQAADAVSSNRTLRYDWLWKLRCPPEVQSLAGNPRYETLLDRLGLPE